MKNIMNVKRLSMDKRLFTYVIEGIINVEIFRIDIIMFKV